MKVQVRNGKIIGIGNGIEENGLEEVYCIDEELLPKKEDGSLDYEIVFCLNIEISEGKVTIKDYGTSTKPE